MKKILIGTTLAAFALAPALGWADCGEAHDKASMASSQPAQKSEQAQAQATTKAATPVVAKATTTKHAKPSVAKTTASKAGASTVVAKNN
jgi:hypothetical protein